MVFLAAQRAHAGMCHTKGRVYAQQKVYDMAATFLECAKEEPENLDVLSLLAFARVEQREYISAGAAFQMGIDAAIERKDEKHLQDLAQNRHAVNIQLAGTFDATSDRTSSDTTTAQGKAERRYGALREFARLKEATGEHEFWYYPETTMMLYFAPGADDVKRLDYAPYEGLGDLQKAVVDTVAFPPYSGKSSVAEASYYFELASYVDPSSLETFQKFTYALCLLGRYEDAIRAAEFALRLHPSDALLEQNLKEARSIRDSH
jgi:tetratricopeptide (TPR) repeat protein